MKRFIVYFLVLAQSAFFFACPSLVQASTFSPQEFVTSNMHKYMNADSENLRQPVMSCCTQATSHTEQAANQTFSPSLDTADLLFPPITFPLMLNTGDAILCEHGEQSSPPFQERSQAKRE